MTTTAVVEKWANFLAFERIAPDRMEYPEDLDTLCRALASRGEPKHTPYSKRIASRELICNVAMDIGYDIASLRYRGKIMISRGLLDVWAKVYRARFGSAAGTLAARELTRRNIKQRLARS